MLLPGMTAQPPRPPLFRGSANTSWRGFDARSGWLMGEFEHAELREPYFGVCASTLLGPLPPAGANAAGTSTESGCSSRVSHW